MNQVKKLLGNGAIYTLSTIVQKAIPFLLLPIMTKYLSTSEYGEVALFLAIGNFVLPFISLNMGLEITRSYQNKKVSKDILSIRVFNILLLASMLFLLIFIVFVAVSYIHPIRINGSRWLFVILPFFALMNFYSIANLTLFQNAERAVPYGIWQNLRTLLQVGGSLYFVVVLYWGGTGRILGMFISTTTIGLASLLHLFMGNKIKFQVDWNYCRDLLIRYSPMILYSLSGIILTTSDRFIVKTLVGSSELGIYSVGYSFGMLMLILNDSVSKAISPQMYRWGNDLNDQNRLNIVKIAQIYTIALISIAFFSSYLLPFIYKWMVNANFNGGIRVIAWIIFGYAFNGMYKMTMIFYVVEKKTGVLSIIMMMTALFNVAISILLVSYNGAVGAAQGTFLAYLLSVIISILYTRKMFQVPWMSLKWLFK